MAINIRTESLSVEIELPGVGFNNTTRFDRAGFITQVTLDGKYDFCTLEPTNLNHPSTGGVGLCNEIRCLSAFEDAEVGRRFAKFGVGLLTKPDDERYIHFKTYECIPFETSYTTSENSVEFLTEPHICDGYAIRQLKEVSVERNMLSMKLRVENVGGKRVTLSEYCHNFITLGRLPLGPKYRLDFPSAVGTFDGKEAHIQGTIFGSRKGFSFCDYCGHAAMMNIMEGEFDKNKIFRWHLTHDDYPVTVTEETSFIPAKVTVWCIDHIISPEVIIERTIEPGETAMWSRIWKFEYK